MAPPPPDGKKVDADLKTSPVTAPMAVLVLATVAGLSLCLAYLRPARLLVTPTYTALVGSDLCPPPGPYLHYPNPRTYQRGECKCTPVRFFAILSMQRSGSGWFETFLNSHINVSSNGEIFSVKERRSNVTAVLATLDKVYNLDWFSSAAKNECLAAVGFKWMLNQGVLKFHEEIVEYFNRRGVSAMFLLRRNLLHRMISILANTYDQSMKQLNGTHKSHVHSEKERLMDVQDFLGVPRRDLVSRQVKIHKKPLPEQISNWNEVYNILKGTKYERFIGKKNR